MKSKTDVGLDGRDSVFGVGAWMGCGRGGSDGLDGDRSDDVVGILTRAFLR